MDTNIMLTNVDFNKQIFGMNSNHTTHQKENDTFQC